MMEELKKIKKADQIPEDIKLKRRIFNSKRYHTQPNQSPVSSHQCQVIRLQTLTSRQQVSQVETKNSQNGYQYKLKKRPMHIKQISLRDKNHHQSQRNRKQKIPKLWDNSNWFNAIKTCRIDCLGYAKRSLRNKQNSQVFSNLFSDSTRITTNRQRIHKNIQIINRALSDSFPKLKLICTQGDQCLKITREEYRDLFNNKTIVSEAFK